MAQYADSGDYTWGGGAIANIPDGEIITGVMDNGEIIGLRIQPADTRTCAQRHDEVIAMLSRRVDRLEAQNVTLRSELEHAKGQIEMAYTFIRELGKTVQNWTGD